MTSRTTNTGYTRANVDSPPGTPPPSGPATLDRVRVPKTLLVSSRNEAIDFEDIVSLSPNRLESPHDFSPRPNTAASTSHSQGSHHRNGSMGALTGARLNQDQSNRSYSKPAHDNAPAVPSTDGQVIYLHTTHTGSTVRDHEKGSGPYSSPQAIQFPMASPYKDFPSPGMDGSSPPFTPRTPRSRFLSGGSDRRMSVFSIPRKAERNPFANSFEPPRWRSILLHVLMCVIAYPILMMFVVIACKRTLFMTRLVVSLGCGLVGFWLGLSLLALGKAFLEAATWATVIHQSRLNDSPGVKLKSLAANSTDPTSAWAALHLLWDRQMYPGTARRRRKDYDRRPWSLYILFFLLTLFVAASLPFVLGRLIDITTTVQHQKDEYEEIFIIGDNSEEDISHASSLKPDLDNLLLTWTLAPFSNHGALPPAVSFQYQNDSVYFSETIMTQLLPNGSGFGSFNTEKPDWVLEEDKENNATPRLEDVTIDPTEANVEPGSIIRFPKWGTRLHCASVPNLVNNLEPESPSTGLTYLFTPLSVIQNLFDSFGDLKIVGSFPPFNASKVLQGNDTLPSGINVSEIAMGAAFSGNGVTHSFFSQPLSMGEDGKGWISLEHVLVRLNATYAPNGTFPVLSKKTMPDVNGNPTHVGYDAVVCVQLFEPWIIEVYNSTTGVPTSIKLVERGNEVRSVDTGKKGRVEKVIGLPLVSQEGKNTRRTLDSTRLKDVYTVAHTNSINQLLKDNGRDSWYVPSQTVISFTDGFGARGYTTLSPEHFGRARGMADASNILSFFAGTGQILARRYNDRVLSNASINSPGMIAYLGIVLLVGLMAGFCVPRLPLDVPRRGFELYSWMAAFHAEELVGDANLRQIRVPKNMELDEIEDAMGELKIMYHQRAYAS